MNTTFVQLAFVVVSLTVQNDQSAIIIIVCSLSQ